MALYHTVWGLARLFRELNSLSGQLRNPETRLDLRGYHSTRDISCGRFSMLAQVSYIYVCMLGNSRSHLSKLILFCLKFLLRGRLHRNRQMQLRNMPRSPQPL
jgi:hypothetical protein